MINDMAALDKFGVKKFFKTKPGSVNYYSNWDSTRTIATNGEDTVDPRLQVTCGSDPLYIGGGIAQWKTLNSSSRMYVNRGSQSSQWLNTEQTIYIRRNKDSNGGTGTNATKSIQLRFRSNHHGADESPYGKVGDVSCGFGNYHIKWGEVLGDNLVSIEIEYIHGMYKRHIVDKTLVIPYDKYVGFKGICRNTDSTHIKLTGYTNLNVSSQENWKKTIEWTFSLSETNSDLEQSVFDFESSGGGGDDRVPICLTGTPTGDSIVQSTKAGMIAKKIFNKPGYWNWVRIENAEHVDMKYYTVREIMPKNAFNPAYL
jgi:hypothetical protein